MYGGGPGRTVCANVQEKSRPFRSIGESNAERGDGSPYDRVVRSGNSTIRQEARPLCVYSSATNSRQIFLYRTSNKTKTQLAGCLASFSVCQLTSRSYFYRCICCWRSTVTSGGEDGTAIYHRIPPHCAIHLLEHYLRSYCLATAKACRTEDRGRQVTLHRRTKLTYSTVVETATNAVTPVAHVCAFFLETSLPFR